MSAVLAEPPGMFEDHQVAQLRMPPHSIEAECSVLGGLLLGGSAAFDRVGDLLTDADFYRHEHRLVFAAISQLELATRPVDVMTVYDQLQGSGKAEEVGGYAYLSSLSQYVPSASNIRRYAEIVRERAILRKLIACSDEIASTAFNTKGRPVADIVDEAAQKMLGVTPDIGADDWQSMESIVIGQLDAIQAQYEEPDDRGGNFTPTGLEDLDELMDGGMRGGQFIVIGARPSMGKTSIGDEIGLHVAMNEQKTVAKFSMEMQNSEGGQRAIANVGSVPLHALRRPKRMSDFDWSNLTRGVEKLRHIPFYSNDEGGLNINQIRGKARALHRRVGKLGLILVDYFQLMSGTDSRAQRNAQLEEASRGLKNLAKELDCPVVALAQINRSVEGEGDDWRRQRARFKDLKDCGSLEQDADVILFLIRPRIAQPGLGDEWKDYAQAHLAKQRGGRTGYLDLMYVGAYTRYVCWPKDVPVPTSKVIGARGKEL
jgi:replicative DNA helicase